MQNYHAAWSCSPFTACQEFKLDAGHGSQRCLTAKVHKLYAVHGISLINWRLESRRKVQAIASPSLLKAPLA
jgi:hypothetical protein